MNTHFQDGFAELTDRQRKIYDVERLLLIALLHGGTVAIETAKHELGDNEVMMYPLHDRILGTILIAHKLGNQINPTSIHAAMADDPIWAEIEGGISHLHGLAKAALPPDCNIENYIKGLVFALKKLTEEERLEQEMLEDAADAEAEMEKIRRNAAQARGSDDRRGHPWPDPIPLPALPSVPAFDLNLLPDILYPWVADMAERARYAPDFSAVSGMVGFGSLVGRRLGIKLKEKDDWTEHGNIWGMMVGLPSALKSPAMREGLAPLKRLQAGADKNAADALQEFNSQKIGVELRNKAIKKSAEKAFDKNLDAKPNLQFEDDPKLPPRRVYWTSDVTVEKLGEILSENPFGLLIERDELSSWLTNLEDEKNAVARGFFLSGWSGKESYRFDRIGRGTTTIPAFALSVIGGIQPGPLDRYVRGAYSGLRADGLLQRFQLAVWPDQPVFEYVDRWPNSAAKEAALALYERVDALKGGDIGTPGMFDDVPVLHFDRTAQGLFAEWFADFQTTQRQREANGEECSALSSHFGKYPGLLGKLALIIHVADRPDEREIGATTLEKALAWLAYLKPHANRIYHAAGVPNVDAAKLLLSKIRNGDFQSPFKARDIYRKCWQGLIDSEQVKAACFTLADYNYLRIKDATPSDKGRPPDPVLKLTPRRTDKTDRSTFVSFVRTGGTHQGGLSFG